jgi:pimeloyl-ACP methyl ester carboxylesterase
LYDRRALFRCGRRQNSLFRQGKREVLTLFHGSHLGTNDACESALDWGLNFDRLPEAVRMLPIHGSMLLRRSPTCPKYREAASKMYDQGLRDKRFLPQLALEKEESQPVQGRLTTPTLLDWGYNDPTAALRRGQYLFELIAQRTLLAEMQVINHAGPFCFRQQP